MIYNLTLNDKTQQAIMNPLMITSALLEQVCSKLSNNRKIANIYCMPDLGIPHNATRVLGGFYTGACYTWKSDIPFIPVDTTVNVCGTGVYKLNTEISVEKFYELVMKVKKNAGSYRWNYDVGNHFVSLTYSDGKYGLAKGQYLVLHASAIEFKYDKEKGLYPVKDVWYYPEIKTHYDTSSNRYLRYIEGKTAEQFYKIAAALKEFNVKRNDDIAELILGTLLESQVTNISHYGMPDIESVCIGCHWENKLFTLLTSPGNPIYLIEPISNQNQKNLVLHNDKELILSPHGFGVEFVDNQSSITYGKDSVTIGKKSFQIGDSIDIDTDTKIRTDLADPQQVFRVALQILKHCPGTIQGELSQICCFSKRGFQTYSTK